MCFRAWGVSLPVICLLEGLEGVGSITPRNMFIGGIGGRGEYHSP